MQAEQGSLPVAYLESKYMSLSSEPSISESARLACNTRYGQDSLQRWSPVSPLLRGVDGTRGGRRKPGHSSSAEGYVYNDVDLLGLKAKFCGPHDSLLLRAFPTCLVLPTPGPLHITDGHASLQGFPWLPSCQVQVADSQQPFSVPHHVPSITLCLDLSSLLSLISTKY